MCFLGFVSAYENQWFASYQELYWNIEFQCDSQCFVMIWDAKLWDYIQLNWSAEWNGIVWYWFLQWQQIIPWWTVQVVQIASLNQRFTFSDSPYRSQLLKNTDTKIMIVVQWNIKWKLNIKLWETWPIDKIFQSWKKFRQTETMTPYSINLRYGVTMWWKSIVQYWYIIFIIASLIILTFGKGKKKDNIIRLWFRALWIFLFIWLRNLITYSQIVHQWLQSYTNQITDNKTFFDLWDYITFTDKIRKTLNLDQQKDRKCSIYIDSIQDRPFKAHRESVYIKPCEVVLTWVQADYIIYFKKPINPEFQSGKILIDFNWSYLLLNK